MCKCMRLTGCVSIFDTLAVFELDNGNADADPPISNVIGGFCQIL